METAMKEIRELKFEEMTEKQKLGFIHTPLLHLNCVTEEALDYVLGLIRERSLGAVWIQWFDEPENAELAKKYISLVREAADYPILIITDLETPSDVRAARSMPMPSADVWAVWRAR